MKKSFVFVLLVCLLSLNSFAQFGVGMFYTPTQIGGPVSDKLNRVVHGYGFDVMFRIKRTSLHSNNKTRFYAGFSYSSNMMDIRSGPIVFTSPEGSQVSTTINLFATFFSPGVYFRTNLFKQHHLFMPYLDVRLGLFRSNSELTIDMPEGLDDCKPLVNELLYCKAVFSSYWGGGIEVGNPDRGFGFFVSGGINLGGNINYISADQSLNVVNTQHGTGHQHGSNLTQELIYTSFINTVTGVIHEHPIGTKYTAPVRMFEFKVGFRIYLSESDLAE
ncbi:MAG: hypothetical protein ACRC3B_21140 [Bacteroidia bacterium]